MPWIPNPCLHACVHTCLCAVRDGQLRATQRPAARLDPGAAEHMSIHMSLQMSVHTCAHMSVHLAMLVSIRAWTDPTDDGGPQHTPARPRLGFRWHRHVCSCVCSVQ